MKRERKERQEEAKVWFIRGKGGPRWDREYPVDTGTLTGQISGVVFLRGASGAVDGGRRCNGDGCGVLSGECVCARTLSMLSLLVLLVLLLFSWWSLVMVWLYSCTTYLTVYLNVEAHHAVITARWLDTILLVSGSVVV